MRYVRDDGRYYVVERTEDLFGNQVVLVAHGGRTPPRVRSVPVGSAEEADAVIADIDKRRTAHGYERVE